MAPDLEASLHGVGAGVPVTQPPGDEVGQLRGEQLRDVASVAAEGLPGFGLLDDADLVCQEAVWVVALGPVPGLAEGFDDEEARWPLPEVVQDLAEAVVGAEVRKVGLVVLPGLAGGGVVDHLADVVGEADRSAGFGTAGDGSEALGRDVGPFPN
ncbi:hypothetical protein [Streptomyces sp. NPDC056525]|uniref:hypothetical protein n=1 Tax=unclassified Streptomyces TaxID=2593676 RepID=UPI00368F6BBF